MRACRRTLFAAAALLLAGPVASLDADVHLEALEEDDRCAGWEERTSEQRTEGNATITESASRYGNACDWHDRLAVAGLDLEGERAAEAAFRYDPSYYAEARSTTSTSRTADPCEDDPAATCGTTRGSSTYDFERHEASTAGFYVDALGAPAASLEFARCRHDWTQTSGSSYEGTYRREGDTSAFEQDYASENHEAFAGGCYNGAYATAAGKSLDVHLNGCAIAHRKDTTREGHRTSEEDTGTTTSVTRGRADCFLGPQVAQRVEGTGTPLDGASASARAGYALVRVFDCTHDNDDDPCPGEATHSVLVEAGAEVPGAAAYAHRQEVVLDALG